MSSYKIKLSSSKDGTVVFLKGADASEDILDVFNAPEASKIADTSKASIPLIRRGARDFADEIGEGMIGMLENFAAEAEPSRPLKGQLWFKTGSVAGPLGQLRVCINPTGSDEAARWGFVSISEGPPNANALKLSLLGDAKPDTYTANSNNEVSVNLTLKEIHSNGVASLSYERPTIKIDRAGRVVSITPGEEIQTGVDWATATSGQVTILGDRNLNVAGVGKVMENGSPLIPSGVIMMWSGSVASIPAGWKLCNGQAIGNKVTPNLTDRFVVGAGGGYAPNATGGSASFAGSGTTSSAGAHDHPVSIAAAGEHTHTGSTGQTALTIDQMPNHQHATNWGESNGRPYPQYGALGGQNGPRNNIGSRDTDFDNWNYLSEPVGGGLGHGHAVASDGTHTHAGSATSAGAHTHTMSVSGSTLPPYYALCYIMKT